MTLKRQSPAGVASTRPQCVYMTPHGYKISLSSKIGQHWCDLASWPKLHGRILIIFGTTVFNFWYNGFFFNLMHNAIEINFYVGPTFAFSRPYIT